MSLIHKLEPRLGRYAVPHLTLGLILFQVAVFVVAQGEMAKAGGMERLTILDRIALEPDKVLEGEIWRLVTFVAAPPCMSLICAAFGWYLFRRFWVGSAAAGGEWKCRRSSSASAPATGRSRTSTAASSAALLIAVIPRPSSAIARSATAGTATAWII
jgi:hypothetical protein